MLNMVQMKKIDVTEIIKNILSKNNNYLILDKKYNVLFKKDPHLGVIKHLNIKYKNNKDDTKEYNLKLIEDEITY